MVDSKNANDQKNIFINNINCSKNSLILLKQI